MKESKDKGRAVKAPRASAGGKDLRAFTAEITFNGLAVMQILGLDKDDRRSANGVKILFVKTHGTEHDGGYDHGHHHGADHRHHPRLTYYADDQLGLLPKSDRWPLDYDYYASPEGRQTVSVDLTGKRVKIIPFYSPDADEKLELLWSKTAGRPSFPNPRRPGEEQCLDWVLSADQIGLKKVRADAAVTVIEPPPGLWKTHGVYRNREVRKLDPIRWRVGAGEQAMGRDVVLELRNLNFGLTLRISNLTSTKPDPYDIVLTPGKDERPAGTAASGADRLRLALTNFPDSYTHADVSHVTMYGQLSGQDKPLESPTQVDDVVCAQAACTPVQQGGGG